MEPMINMDTLITDYLHCYPAGVYCVLSKRLKTCRDKGVKNINKDFLPSAAGKIK